MLLSGAGFPPRRKPQASWEPRDEDVRAVFDTPALLLGQLQLAAAACQPGARLSPTQKGSLCFAAPFLAAKSDSGHHGRCHNRKFALRKAARSNFF